jgi:ethanolamine utilization protein EutN
MRIGTVIGKVTLNQSDPALRGGRFLLVQPWSRDDYAKTNTQTIPTGPTIVMYDDLGAGVGDFVGFTEGAEASAPFEKPTPIDAYNAALIDTIFYNPPSASNA